MKRLNGMWVCLALFWVAMAAQARTMHFYYTDPQGTVLAKTDAQGNILARYDYKPYGGVVSGQGPNGPGYTGHENDTETGLVYMQARYYDPVGRFLSPDPVGPAPGNIFSFNRYTYADNNPVLNTDPDGRKVFIKIKRTWYTNKSIVSKVTVTSDKTNQSFHGYTLENAHAGVNGNKSPTPAGTYKAVVRSAKSNPKLGRRLELQNVPGHTAIEIHPGNTPGNSHGCFLTGTSRKLGGKVTPNWVANSKVAMGKINGIVQADGSGNISVSVEGSPVQQKQQGTP